MGWLRARRMSSRQAARRGSLAGVGAAAGVAESVIGGDGVGGLVIAEEV